MKVGGERRMKIGGGEQRMKPSVERATALKVGGRQDAMSE